MSESAASEVTLLLKEWREGDKKSLDKLISLVYDELRRLAHHYLHQERADHTLQTTALVNEAYLRLIDAGNVHWQDRTHFFAISSNLMRRILVDYARARGSKKRGENMTKITIDENHFVPTDRNILKLDDALSALSKFDSRKVKVVELRYFGGLSLKETAQVLKISPDTVRRDWRMAKAWLLCELKDYE
ncbi:MAG: sigma-70 family RNA polymerase sigma factor [Acidobacteriota bacterium]